MQTVFVTGGSGFVGRNLIRALRQRGISVRALARSPRAQAAVRALGAEVVPADLDTLQADALRGCDTVFHAAAQVAEWGSKASFWHVNVDGTAALLTVARAAGVRRFVHVSTEAVLADGKPLREVDETHPYPARPLPRYAASKQAAEQRVRAANSAGFETVVIRPRLIWGDDDTSLLPQLAAAARAGKFMWIDGGRQRTSTCHVRNVVHGALLAAERGTPGGVYFLTDGAPQPTRDFFTRLFATQGIPAPTRSLPFALAYGLAALCEALWNLLPLPGQPPISRLPVALFGNDITVVAARAQQELGYRPVITVDEGLSTMSKSGI
ncbi:MAG TPA: NAD-dependent epimerase/dehydratase family protein [Solimonas sp.]